MINNKRILIIIGLIILLVGIPLTLYLVGQAQIFKPKAAFVPKAEFVDASENIITQTGSLNVKLRIRQETAGSPIPSKSPTVSPDIISI